MGRLKIGEDVYAAYFPQERPLDGVQIRVWAEDGTLLGDGIGTHLRESGGAIRVAGKTYDSNKVVHWATLERLAEKGLL